MDAAHQRVHVDQRSTSLRRSRNQDPASAFLQSGGTALNLHLTQGFAEEARDVGRPRGVAFRSIRTGSTLCKPRRFLVAQIGNLLCRRLAVGGHLRITNPRHGRPLVCATRVAAPSRCAVSWVSKSANRATTNATPTWELAPRQLWKPALRSSSL